MTGLGAQVFPQRNWKVPHSALSKESELALTQVTAFTGQQRNAVHETTTPFVLRIVETNGLDFQFTWEDTDTRVQPHTELGKTQVLELTTQKCFLVSCELCYN